MARDLIKYILGLLSICLLASGSAARDRDQFGSIDEQALELQAEPPSMIATDALAINNPSSIPEQLRRDWQSKDYLFQIPGFNRVLQPWYNVRKRLDEQYGFKPQFSFTN